MGNVRYVKNPQTSLPVCTIDESPSKPRVIGVLARPSLNRHVVNVYPSSKSRLPAYFRLPDFHDPRKVTISREVEMGDCDPPTCVSLSHIALFIIWVCYKNIPFVIYHVSVEVVGATRMVSIIPRVDPARIGFVRNID